MTTTHASTPLWVHWLNGHRKAIAGAITAELAALSAALVDGHISGGEVPVLIGALLVGGGLVHGVGNTGPLAPAGPVAADVTGTVGDVVTGAATVVDDLLDPGVEGGK